jgi:DNA segregation ATPase FtsK/SpoIIIE, S-DNA-T family
MSVIPFPQSDDDEPDAPPASAAEPEILTGKVIPGRSERRPIIPEPWQRANWRKTLADIAGLRWHQARFHGIRVFAYIPLSLMWAAVGIARLGLAVTGWWWVVEQTYLRLEAIAANDPRTWLSLHKHAREARLLRGLVILAGFTVLIILASCISVYARLLWIPIGLAVIPWLAYVGRPANKPIIKEAIVPERYERLTQELVIHALSTLGITLINQGLAKDPDNPERVIEFRDPIMRDGPGWRAACDLPRGVTAAQVMDKRNELASALRRHIGCVWPENNRKRHPGALVLWVGDEDMSTARQPAWPLAKRGVADMFAPVGFATDQRGRPITITLMFVSIIIGSVPRMGKTFLLRLLLLICALDVRCEIHAYDLKGTGDLAPLRPVAHRYRAGDEGDDIEYLIADYRALRKEMRRRTKMIRDLADSDENLCPENKVTTELASQKKFGLHPIAIAVDECQVMFEHPEYGGEFEQIATDLAKRGPALGMLQMLSTQRPDAKSIPTGISANVVLRMCLKVMGQVENDMVLGQSAHKNGFRATMFDFEDKGIFYFGGEGSAPRIARSQYIDNPAAKVIAERARVVRERAGRLTGYALGQDQEVEIRSFLDDVLSMFGDDDKLWRETIAARLAGSFPNVYADITPDAVGSQLRKKNVKVKRVRETGKEPRWGCDRAAVAEAYEAALETGDA